MTREVPILFSAPMVQAILAGTKTQTRRVLGIEHPCRPELDSDRREWQIFDGDTVAYRGHLRWVHGDRLWIKERWSGLSVFQSIRPSERASFSAEGAVYHPETVWYWADGNPTNGDWEKPRPSMFMPRWASRILLKVTGVRVQRLQDITSADAIAEGCTAQANSQTIDCDTRDPRDEFRGIWHTINGAASWDVNPWVAAITFERIKP